MTPVCITREKVNTETNENTMPDSGKTWPSTGQGERPTTDSPSHPSKGVKTACQLILWSQTSSFQNCEAINFCWVSHPVYGTLVTVTSASYYSTKIVYTFFNSGQFRKSGCKDIFPIFFCTHPEKPKDPGLPLLAQYSQYHPHNCLCCHSFFKKHKSIWKEKSTAKFTLQKYACNFSYDV